MSLVATGTAGAQAISMAFAPLITRIYGPEAFGVLGTFMALLPVNFPVIKCRSIGEGHDRMSAIDVWVIGCLVDGCLREDPG